MITHDEFVAGQRIQSVFELFRLGYGHITDVRQPVVLSLQKILRRRLGDEAETLREDECKWRSKQRIEHPRSAWSRILFNPQHCTEAGPRRRAVLKSFKS